MALPLILLIIKYDMKCPFQWTKNISCLIDMHLRQTQIYHTVGRIPTYRLLSLFDSDSSIIQVSGIVCNDPTIIQLSGIIFNEPGIIQASGIIFNDQGIIKVSGIVFNEPGFKNQIVFTSTNLMVIGMLIFYHIHCFRSSIHWHPYNKFVVLISWIWKVIWMSL